MKIFDIHVQPITQYGSEIWGLSKAAHHCESVHLLALKKFLGVDRRTPNDLIYGETNRYPIFINSAVQCIRYWFKLLRMDMSRIPRKAYNMLFDLDVRGKKNWVTDVRTCLYRYGFGVVWENQGVGHEFSFLKIFRQRLIDSKWQEWSSHIENSDRFNMYRTFSSIHDVKPYLLFDIDTHLQRVTTRFRLGISALATHKLRYKTVNAIDLICPLSGMDKDDELHFVFFCPAFKEIRAKYIAPKFVNHPNAFKLVLLMSSTKNSDVLNFAIFLHKAFKYREIAMS